MIKLLRFLETALPNNYIIVFGLILRLLFFVTVCFIPIPFGPAPPISPFHYQVGVDLQNYIDIAQAYYTSLGALSDLFGVYYKLFYSFELTRLPVTGPFYPLLLVLLDYSPTNTLPLSIVVFILEMSAFYIWCLLGRNVLKGLPGILFAMMPHSIWFGLLISTDVIFYLFCSIFFYLYFVKNSLPVKLLYAITIALILVRPMAPLFCIALTLISKQKLNPKDIGSFRFISILILVFSIIFYSPYFLITTLNLSDMNVTGNSFSLWVFGSNVLKLFGIHPSKSGFLLAEIVRVIYGIIFITGFIGVLFLNKWLGIISISYLLFTSLFFEAGWRYTLPLLPLFYIFGIQMFNDYVNSRKLQMPKFEA